MDETQKKALYAKLSAAELYLRVYKEQSRKWFSKKMVDLLVAANVADDQVETVAKTKLNKAKLLIKTQIDAITDPTGEVSQQWLGVVDTGTYTNICYDAIAIHPAFLDQTDAKYFSHITLRRLRILNRLKFTMDPDKNIFDYQDETCTVWKVNSPSTPYWVTGNTPGPQDIPYVLTTQGSNNTVTAVGKLFEPATACDKNILGCESVAMVLHIDSLLVATDKAAFLECMTNEGFHYLKIDHPHAHFGTHVRGNLFMGVTKEAANPGVNQEIELGSVGKFFDFQLGTYADPSILETDTFYPLPVSAFCQILLGADHERIEITAVNPVSRKIRIFMVIGTYAAGAKIYLDNITTLVPPVYHLTTDTRHLNALFEQVAIKMEDLQIGDHIYLANHPLYQYLDPIGVWAGEHAFVTQIGDRSFSDNTFQTDFLAVGHGLDGTVAEIGQDMLDTTNTLLSGAQGITKAHLANLKVNGTTSTAKVRVITRMQGGVNCYFFEYDMQVKFTDFSEEEADKREKTMNGFVIRQEVADEKRFWIYNAGNKDSTVTVLKEWAVSYVDDAAFGPATKFNPDNWGMRYYHPQKVSIETFYLFEVNTGVPHLLSFDDLKMSGLFFQVDRSKDVYVVRPRVDFTADYQNYLATIGAF